MSGRPLTGAAARHMAAAVAQARLAARRGEVPVGAVIVRDGMIVARGRNEIIARRDPTAHAEVLAIRAAAARLRNERLPGCTLYTTLEPCPMCAGAIIHARLDTVVFGARDPKRGRPNHHTHRIGPVDPGRSGRLLRSFFRKRRRTRAP